MRKLTRRKKPEQRDDLSGSERKMNVRERRLSRKLEGRENLHAAGWTKEAEL